MNATSRVIRDDTLPEAAKLDAKARDDTLLEEALGGKPAPALKRAYLVMLGLSSHDLSAMRELLGTPKRVLFAAQRVEGSYLAAAFDYGPYVCQFETGIDHIARFDAHLEVYGDQKVARVRYHTPYVRNSPIRLIVRGGERSFSLAKNSRTGQSEIGVLYANAKRIIAIFFIGLPRAWIAASFMDSEPA